MRRHGGLWFPDDENLSVEFRRLLDEPHGYHGDRLLEALTQVKKFTTAVDCGAHVGTWTRTLADRFERVLAFEPDPESAACLRANTTEFANVEPIEAALGETFGAVSLASKKGRVGTYVQPGLDVKMWALDDWKMKHLGYMKVHANGYELQVLKGAERTIANCRPVLTVVFKPKPETTARYGYTTEELEQFVLSLGYKPGTGAKPYKVFVPR